MKPPIKRIAKVEDESLEDTIKKTLSSVKTKASDTLRKTKHALKGRNDYTDDIEQPTADRFQDIVDYNKEYTDSPKFRERIEKAGYPVEKYVNLHKEKLDNLSLQVGESRNGAHITAAQTSNPTITVTDSPKASTRKYGRSEMVLAHEVGHIYDNKNAEPFIGKVNIIGNTGNGKSHDARPREVVADVHATRRELYNNKVHDGRYSNFTDAAYKEMIRIAGTSPNTASSHLLKNITTPKNFEAIKAINRGAKGEELKKAKKALRDNAKESKKIIFDLMNTTVNNNKPGVPRTTYAAMGGKIRPSSRQRGIAPVIGAALISGGISAITSVLGIGAAAKAKKEQEALRLKDEMNKLGVQRGEQAIGDANTFNQTDIYGEDDVEYYADGGVIENASSFSPDQLAILKRSISGANTLPADAPVSASGYQTQGGILKPIGDGVEEVVGNKHNDTTIDGVSGVQLHANGKLEAEVEDKEVIADGDKVYSQRLKFDKKDSYADKIKKLVKQRNKLERKQEGITSKREKNTIERQLAGLNMAENALFEHQEAAKTVEGLQVARTFALGGRIKKLVSGGPVPKQIPRKPFNIMMRTGKYKGWGRNEDGQYRRPSDDEKLHDVVVDKDGEPLYPYEANSSAAKIPSALDMTKKTVPTNAINAAVNTSGVVGPVNRPISTTAGKGQATSWDKDGNSIPDLVQASGAVNAPEVTTPVASSTSALGKAVANANAVSTKDAALAKGIGIASDLAPMLIDNIGNLIINKNTPKLTAPLLNRVQPLETRVNVNPQLAEIRRVGKAAKDDVLNNTSNSNTARANMVAANLGMGRQESELLGNKENQELGLRNANVQNVQNTTMANNAIVNQHSMNEYQRVNDINSQKKANLANLAGDIKTTMQMQNAKNNFKGYTMANLADDDNGSKMMVYLDNPEFMKDPSNRSFILNRLEEKDENGEYKFIGQRTKAKQLGLLQ